MLLPCPLLAQLLLAALIVAAGDAVAAEAPRPPTPPPLSPLAMSCLACHEPSVDAATMPALTHRPSAAIAASLHAARDDPQPGSIMARYAAFLSDAEIEALAGELGRADQRPSPR